MPRYPTTRLTSTERHVHQLGVADDGDAAAVDWVHHVLAMQVRVAAGREEDENKQRGEGGEAGGHWLARQAGTCALERHPTPRPSALAAPRILSGRNPRCGVRRERMGVRSKQGVCQRSPRVLWVHRHGRIAQHRLNTGGRHHDLACVGRWRNGPWWGQFVPGEW